MHFLDNEKSLNSHYLYSIFEELFLEEWKYKLMGWKDEFLCVVLGRPVPVGWFHNAFTKFLKNQLLENNFLKKIFTFSVEQSLHKSPQITPVASVCPCKTTQLIQADKTPHLAMY